ncbi:serine hydrolase domain-containing protein [Pyxidicoccus caerfyrddinensis]|uniref:serine hydrolase domain-containing protein n=1 Tax=Pyxidicoccus caerfyrddinensis TaxID=2709663 RepID=UPI0013DCD0AE|nr:serine hydrolase domain-containing protein [Pyxidicoccus caerfyrddinensis]
MRIPPPLLALLVLVPLHPRAEPAPTRRAATAPGRAAQRAEPTVALDRALERRVDAILAEEMRRQELPGAIVAVVRGGTVVVKKGYGEKRRGGGERPDSATVFHIGSLSKALAAVGALTLVQRGQLGLDEPAARYLPELPKAWRAITVRQFLAHSSGIGDKVGQPATWQEALAGYAGAPLTFAAGTRTDYTNFNYAVVGRLMESASGRPFVTFMREDVWRPLGMVDTGYPATARNLATGHERKKGAWREMLPEPQGLYGVPSGFLSTTLDDLVRLHAALERNVVLDAATREAMLKPYPAEKKRGGGMVLGWSTSRVGGRNGALVVSKNGAADGFSSLFTWLPGRGDAVIVVVNRKGEGVETARIVARLAEAAFGLELRALEEEG